MIKLSLQFDRHLANLRVNASVLILVLVTLGSARDLTAQNSNHPPAVVWSASERARILSFGPWPSPNSALDSPQRRQVNPLAGHPMAIAFGERLFKDIRLSANHKVSCETCHQAKLGFTDGRVVGVGLELGQRNTLPLFDLAEQRWFGWDGGTDSLWAASIRPMLDPKEMGATASSINKVLMADASYAPFLSSLTDLVPSGSSTQAKEQKTLVVAAMSLAAWMDTIESERSPFDRYRDALLQGTRSEGFSTQAERGLSIFIGKGNCWLCHGGARFSHGEFHDIGRPFMVQPKQPGAALEVDPGRYRGIERVKRDPFNLLGRWSPDSNSSRAQLVDQTLLQHRNWGEWKIPSLRNLKQTAPYMHDGSLATLREVVLHYSELNEERLHADGEALLKPLRLTAQEVKDLVSFLESLSP
jgi:cytochrome c peroxidase